MCGSESWCKLGTCQQMPLGVACWVPGRPWVHLQLQQAVSSTQGRPSASGGRKRVNKCPRSPSSSRTTVTLVPYGFSGGPTGLSPKCPHRGWLRPLPHLTRLSPASWDHLPNKPQAFGGNLNKDMYTCVIAIFFFFESQKAMNMSQNRDYLLAGVERGQR